MPRQPTRLSPAEKLFGSNMAVPEKLYVTENSTAAARTSHLLAAEAATQLAKARVLAMREDALAKASTTRTEILSRFVLVKYPSRPPNKLSPGWRGPMRRVSSVKQSGVVVAYMVKDLGQPGAEPIRVDASRVRKFVPGTLSEEQIKQVAAAGVEEWYIDRISKSRGTGSVSKREYLVHWQGFEDSEATWEPYRSLRDAAALDDFLSSAQAKSEGL
ncbi:Chromo (CHRromatin Organization MOdifier) domain [Carpediemonas membranifera]|uniref:Chromo (CHRromatin Organization MOdifier) domain n=1 Tax=Carpediemonas membranifera TaxID=201153 RepID=A0A8J6E393_9EUKA|nr:Chromo (CHRromatin Organization MOdifier) domain [Carpediemonas membranifera]|eukprot:KAG9395321.1 Chromo (CHRromatin Organization MOdifier) domain [Carpediemonas membranifera]